jgi:hypothetical protein
MLAQSAGPTPIPLEEFNLLPLLHEQDTSSGESLLLGGLGATLVAFWVFWQAAGARRFYVIVGISTAAGIALDFAKISPLKAPYWSAIVNELLASFLLVGVLLVASSRKLMEKQPSSVLGRVAVGVATLLMFGAAIGTFVF